MRKITRRSFLAAAAAWGGAAGPPLVIFCPLVFGFGLLPLPAAQLLP